MWKRKLDPKEIHRGVYIFVALAYLSAVIGLDKSIVASALTVAYVVLAVLH